MAHFVPIPPDREYWVPKLRELSLNDANGTAAIAVWGAMAGSELRADSNDGFVAQPYNRKNDLTFFYLRGLIGGDKVALFDSAGRQQTGWLGIKKVAGDHFAKKRAAGTLPRSKHQNNIILDPHGALQRHPPVKEEDWLSAMELTIAKVRANPVGRMIFGSITRDVTVRPFIPSEENANSAVVFTPQSFAGKTAPGEKPDEVLFHEFCHVLEKDFGGYANVATDGLKFSGSDFFTVMATNVYASVAGRPLRADHAGFRPMIPLYASPTTGVAKLKSNHSANFSSIKTRMPAIASALGRSGAAWNPFK